MKQNSNMLIETSEKTAIDEYLDLKLKLALTKRERAIYEIIYNNERRHKKLPCIRVNDEWNVI